MATFQVYECDGCGARRELTGGGWQPDEAASWRIASVRQVAGMPLAEVILCSDCSVVVTGAKGMLDIGKPRT